MAMARPTTHPTPTLERRPAIGFEDSFARHREAFAERFGGEGVRTFFSPGRVNLFGGHLDYNGGPVLPTAIDRGTFIAVAPRTGRGVRIASVFDEEAFEGTLDDLPAAAGGRWFDYVLGVLHSLQSLAGTPGGRGLDAGFDLLFGGNLPVGAGLSSSASITVGTAFALDQVFGLGLGPAERVAAALDAERGFVGVQCGIMDPFAVGYARDRHALWLDCKDETFEHLPLDFDRLVIGVFDTGVQRELARSEFNRRVAECRAAFDGLVAHAPGAEVMRDVPLSVVEEHLHELPEEVGRRALHVAREVERTFRARESLFAGDYPALGAAMTETHGSLRDLYECSCEELDALVEMATATPGVFGARLTGAGFGGCVVTLLEASAEGDVFDAVSAAYDRRYGRRPPAAFFQGDAGPREIAARS